MKDLKLYNKNFCHAELVSASMFYPQTQSFFARWTLKHQATPKRSSSFAQARVQGNKKINLGMKNVRRIRLIAIFLSIILLLSTPFKTQAFEVEKRLSDPAQEARAQSLFQEIRCVVCVSQSIADSDVDLARDMRRLVRDSILEGKTNQQIYDFLIERYGQQVILRPPFVQSTTLLWIAPFIFLAFGVLLLVLRTQRQEK